MFVGVGDSREVEASAGDDVDVESDVEEVGVGDPPLSSVLVEVDDSSVVESSSPPGPSLSLSEDDSCLLNLRAIFEDLFVTIRRSQRVASTYSTHMNKQSWR